MMQQQQEPDYANPLAPLYRLDGVGTAWPMDNYSLCLMLAISSSQRLRVTLPKMIEHPEWQHFHLYSGNLGVMPTMDLQVWTQSESRELIRTAVNVMYEHCDRNHPGRCHIGSYKDGGVTYKPNHPQAYAKVAACFEDSCSIIKESRIDDKQLERSKSHTHRTYVPSTETGHGREGSCQRGVG